MIFKLSDSIGLLEAYKLLTRNFFKKKQVDSAVRTLIRIPLYLFFPLHEKLVESASKEIKPRLRFEIRIWRYG